MSALLALSAARCGDNYGERCALPRVVEQNCKSDSPDSATSCVMTDNLSCDSRVCAVWQDSTSFCTVDCAADADCPDDSACVPFFLDSESDKFCVMKSLLQDNPPPAMSGGGGASGGGASGGGEGGPAAGEGEGEGEAAP